MGENGVEIFKDGNLFSPPAHKQGSQPQQAQGSGGRFRNQLGRHGMLAQVGEIVAIEHAVINGHVVYIDLGISSGMS